MLDLEALRSRRDDEYEPGHILCDHAIHELEKEIDQVDGFLREKNRRILQMKAEIHQYEFMFSTLNAAGIDIVRDDTPSSPADPCGQIGYKVIFHG